MMIRRKWGVYYKRGSNIQLLWILPTEREAREHVREEYQTDTVLYGRLYAAKVPLRWPWRKARHPQPQPRLNP